jgi:hypothetical protein
VDGPNSQTGGAAAHETDQNVAGTIRDASRFSVADFSDAAGRADKDSENFALGDSAILAGGTYSTANNFPSCTS